MDRAERYVMDHGFDMNWAFFIWGSKFMDAMKIGGIRIGNQWLKDPSTWGDYGWMINEILPGSSEDMLTFCKCKFRVEMFFAAILERYDVIEKIVKHEANK